MTDLRYRVEMTPDDNDTFLVTCPDLPEVTTFGDDEDDATIRAADAITEALAARIAGREAIPEPHFRGGRPVDLPLLVQMKVRLYMATREQGVRKSEMAKRLSAHGPQIDRLFNLRHSSKVEQIEEAFRALGKRVDIDVQPAA
ncbi:hypothetical protein STAQ_41700 [Allostella sp. ATCC 35155]|nr:hypothetical protein STAQ_41700 [Stella sp. ATCC 35155]